MALPASGAISLNNVNVELGLSGTAAITMNDSAVRSLAGVPSGQISMSNLQGKSAQWTGTISTPQQQMNLYTWATGQGYPGSGVAQITVGPGVYIWSDSTATAAMTVPSGFGAGNLTLVNNGYIMGKGGAGGSTSTGNPGGPAISVSQPITINNTNGSAYIGGGGGGGGGVRWPGSAGNGGAGGAGGGAGAPLVIGTPSTTGPGGAGGAIGSVGGLGAAITVGPVSFWASQGGGRIFPGTGGTQAASTRTAGGAGGAGDTRLSKGTTNPGAAGGAANNGGASAPNPAVYQGGGGGGWGASGGTGRGTSPTGGPVNTPAGGAGGKSVALNGNSVTWTSGDTTRVWGSVS